LQTFLSNQLKGIWSSVSWTETLPFSCTLTMTHGTQKGREFSQRARADAQLSSFETRDELHRRRASRARALLWTKP
jgi:hypothetical protein